MNTVAFGNAMRMLSLLSRGELVGAGIIPTDGLASWKQFQDDPFRFYLRAEEKLQHELWALVYAKLEPLEMRKLPRQALVLVDGLEVLRGEAEGAYRRTSNTRWFDRATFFKNIAGFMLGTFIDHDARVAELLRANVRSEQRARDAVLALYAERSGLGRDLPHQVDTAA